MVTSCPTKSNLQFWKCSQKDWLYWYLVVISWLPPLLAGAILLHVYIHPYPRLASRSLRVISVFMWLLSSCVLQLTSDSFPIDTRKLIAIVAIAAGLIVEFVAFWHLPQPMSGLSITKWTFPLAVHTCLQA